MKKSMLALCATMSLAACQAQAPITQAPAAAQLNANFDTNRINPSNGSIQMAVRAYQKNEDKAEEVVGIPCTLTSDDLSAKIITPQHVIIPRFSQKEEFNERGVPSSILIECESADLAGKQLVTPREKSATMVHGGGIALMILSAAVTAAVGTLTPWEFPELARVPVEEK